MQEQVVGQAAEQFLRIVQHFQQSVTAILVALHRRFQDPEALVAAWMVESTHRPPPAVIE